MKILVATDGSECSLAALRSVASRPWPEDSKFKVISIPEPFMPLGEFPQFEMKEIESLNTAAHKGRKDDMRTPVRRFFRRPVWKRERDASSARQRRARDRKGSGAMGRADGRSRFTRPPRIRPLDDGKRLRTRGAARAVFGRSDSRVFCPRRNNRRRVEERNNAMRVRGNHDGNTVFLPTGDQSRFGHGVDVDGELRVFAGGGKRRKGCRGHHRPGHLHRARNARPSLGRGDGSGCDVEKGHLLRAGG